MAGEVEDAPEAGHRRKKGDVVGVVEAAHLVGVHPNTLAARLRDGLFEGAVRDRTEPGHPWRISRSVVLEMGPAVRKRTPRQERVEIEGELAAQAFALFDACTPLDKVVMQLKALPPVILTLFRQWKEIRAESDAWLAPKVEKPSAPPKLVDWRTVK